MQAPQYIRASVVAYLAGVCGEKARQQVVAGTYGPRYQPKGCRRQTYVRLATVMSVLGLDEAALAAGVARYRQTRKLSRAPIISASVKSLRVLKKAQRESFKWGDAA